MFDFSLYLLTGLVAGVLAGLLGIGGGIIIVPTLAYIFAHKNMPAGVIMHMAESTALAAIVLTTLVTVTIKQQIIHWKIFQRLFPGIIVGSLLGVAVANLLASNVLKILFGVFISLISIYLFLIKEQEEVAVLDTYRKPWLDRSIGLIAGGLSGILGIGGSIFIVPYLLRSGLSTHSAIATSSVCVLLISVMGTLGYMILGWHVTETPPWSTGYIYWLAVLGIAFASIFFVPLGSMVANKLSGKVLARIFSIFLFIVGMQMLFG